MLGRKPTPEEIAEEMELPIEEVRKMQRIAALPISLETPVGEEGEERLGDFVADERLTPEDVVANEVLKTLIQEVLKTLTEREEKVLKMRFGLEDGRSRSLEEVGKTFGVTRERIRQIEAKALRKLRHPTKSRKLEGFL